MFTAIVPRATKLAIRLLGVAVFALTTWQATLLLAALARNHESVELWLQLGVTAAVWVPCCWIGSIALLLGQYKGIWFFCLAGIFTLISWIPDLAVSACVLIGGASLIMSLSWLVDHYYPQPPAAHRPVLFRVGLGLLILVLGVAFIAQRTHRLDAPQLIRDGVAAYQAGRDDKAVAIWSKAIDHSLPGSTDWAIAAFNTGIAHREHHRYNEAIAIFTLLLNSDANDEEYELDANGHFNLMAPFRNYHHRACLQIADCHEKLGDRASTVQYLQLARDKYPHRSVSATPMMHIRKELDKRIKALE